MSNIRIPELFAAGPHLALSLLSQTDSLSYDSSDNISASDINAKAIVTTINVAVFSCFQHEAV